MGEWCRTSGGDIKKITIKSDGTVSLVGPNLMKTGIMFSQRRAGGAFSDPATDTFLGLYMLKDNVLKFSKENVLPGEGTLVMQDFIPCSKTDIKVSSFSQLVKRLFS